MPWCPKCRNEYYEGIKVCADCGCELVAKKPVETAGEEDMPPETQLFVEEEQARNAQSLPEQPETGDTASELYVDSKMLAKENRSSAWVFLVAGALGLVAIALGMTGILPWGLGDPYVFYSVMTAVFLCFVAMGVMSMKSAEIFAKKAESEYTLRDTIMQWCKESLKAEEIDETVIEKGSELPEGVIYFRRVDMLKERINHQFMNLDQTFLEHFIDTEVYDVVFGEKHG